MDLPRLAESKVAFHLFDRLADPSFEELLSKLDRQRPGGGVFSLCFEASFNIPKTTP
jgi:hypothetical protein